MAKETLSSNNNMFEVTSDISPVNSQTINSGFNIEKNNFTISFRSKKNQPTTIGTLSVTAAENKRFLKSPRLVKSKKNNYITNSGVLRKKLKTVTKDSDKNITSYTYDLIYTAFENTTIGNPAIYDITNRARAIVVRDSGIRNVEFGKDYFYSNGVQKEIKITGIPGSEFEIIVTKINDLTDSSGNIVNSTEESITKSIGTGSNISTTILGDGNEYSSIKGTIRSDGKFSFIQKFPKATTKTRYAINVKNSSISSKFPVKRWLLDRDKWNGWYSRILNQYVPVTLTLRATTTSSVYTIDKNSSGSFATWNPSTPADLTYSGIHRKNMIGKRNTNGTYDSNFTVTYVIFSSGHAISLKTGDGEGTPVFNSGHYPLLSEPSPSDWSNSSKVENGGTLLEMNNISTTISTTSTSNDTLTISFDVVVRAWGTKDVIMTLDTDTIFTR